MVEESTFRPKIKKPDEKISEIYTALKYFKQGEFGAIGDVHKGAIGDVHKNIS